MHRPADAQTQPVQHADVRREMTVRSLADDAFNEVIEQYCQRCHGERRQRGDLSLQDFDAAFPERDAATSERIIKKLRAGMMPPVGARRPAGDTLVRLATALETRIDAMAAENINPGHRTFLRLNRAEYHSAVRDLLGISIDVNAFLPTETISNNFDNIADVQTPSATQMEGYLRAAAYVSRAAVGDPEATPTSVTYKVPRTASQLDRVDGAPVGTRGGVSVVHNFLADGNYVFRVELHPGPTGFLYGLTQTDAKVEISIDGERVALIGIDRWMSESDPNGMTMETEPVYVRAGAQRITAAFLEEVVGPVDDLVKPVEHTLADTEIGRAYGVTTVPHLRDFVIVGPFDVTGVSNTPSRQKIFACRPTSPDEAYPCARDILSNLATRAYRRPLTENDIDGLMSFYESGAESGTFETGIRTGLQAILASPHFLFRVERSPTNVSPGEVYPVADHELAARLSFFLWSTGPDVELIELADAGGLSSPDVLEQQVRRMLADSRSEALATRFASQWLRLQDLDKHHPDALLYPYYDHTLSQSMRRETELLFDHLLREDRSVFELLNADYTFVNERLARHYGIPNVTGTEFRRVTHQDENRRGLLGHGSILAMTSHADRTSPVLRGKWVMEVLLGSPPPPPPPNVPDLEATDEVADGRVLTVRERLEQHRANPACSSCHRMMDPIGLALEHFDLTGAWRIKDSGSPIDATGEMFDGTPVRDPSDLRNALMQWPVAFVRNFIENMMAYALGRRIEFSDMPSIRVIERVAAENGNRMSSFILGVVRSSAFQMRSAEVATARPGQ